MMRTALLSSLLFLLMIPSICSAQTKGEVGTKDTLIARKAVLHVTYIVNADSSVNNARVRLIECKACNSDDKKYYKATALDIIKRSPKAPVMKDGKPQRTQYMQPVVVDLTDTVKATK